MSAQITLNWEKDLTFETLLDGHKVTIDRDMENGGNDEGPRPKALMLVALAGCSAMDVIPLFNKMRVRFEKVSIDVKAESSDTIPMVYIPHDLPYPREQGRRSQDRQGDPLVARKILRSRPYDEKDRPYHVRDPVKWGTVKTIP